MTANSRFDAEFMMDLDFRVESVSFLAFQTNCQSFVFAEKLNRIYGLQLTRQPDLLVKMPSVMCNDLASEAIDFYAYADEAHQLLYVLVEVPYGTLSTKITYSYLDKYLFVYGARAEERVTELFKDLDEKPVPETIDVCDWRQLDHIRRRDELCNNSIISIQYVSSVEEVAVGDEMKKCSYNKKRKRQTEAKEPSMRKTLSVTDFAQLIVKQAEIKLMNYNIPEETEKVPAEEEKSEKKRNVIALF